VGAKSVITGQYLPILRMFKILRVAGPIWRYRSPTRRSAVEHRIRLSLAPSATHDEFQVLEARHKQNSSATRHSKPAASAHLHSSKNWNHSPRLKAKQSS
jgi:hypothetical protein